MGKIALLFAGQGAQYPGMGKDFYDNSPLVQDIFAQVERQRPGTKEQCFNGSKEELSVTINTQPCLFAVDYAIAKAVQEAGVPVDAAAGFSLGEIPALAFAGLLDLPQAFHLVCRRAEAMQHAAEENPGGMQAILKLSAEQIASICGNRKRSRRTCGAIGSQRCVSQPIHEHCSRSAGGLCANADHTGGLVPSICQQDSAALHHSNCAGFDCQSGQSSCTVGENH